MRIALCLPNLAGGGAERSLTNLANGMVAAGHAVEFALFRKQGEFLDSLDKRVNVVELGVDRASKAAGPLAEYMSQAKLDGFMSALDHVNVAALVAAQKAKPPFPVSISLRNNLSQEAAGMGLKKKVEMAMAKRLYPKAHAIICVSEGVANDAAAFLKAPRELFSVIYNPIVTPEFERMATEEPNHPWFTDGKAPVVLGVGRLEPQKDFPLLIEASAIASKVSPHRLMILGEGALLDDLIQLSRRFGRFEETTFPGFQKNPISFMKRSALFVLSSKFEGLPGALIQALAAGATVVSTDCPSGPFEVLEGGKWGTLTPVGDVQALASAIVHGLNNPLIAPPEALDRFREAHVVDQFITALTLAKVPA